MTSSASKITTTNNQNNNPNLPFPPHPLTSHPHCHLKYLLCGAVAGAVSRSCTAPLDRLKVLLQTQLAPPIQGGPPISLKATIQNLNSACSAIYKCGGLPSFWRGNGLNCMKIFPESGIKFYVFERAKIQISSISLDTPSSTSSSSSSTTSIGIGGRFIAGGLAGLVSQFSIYPIETLKTRVMAATAAATTNTSTTQPQQHQLSSHPVPSRNLNHHYHQSSSTLLYKPVLSRSIHIQPHSIRKEKTYSLVLRTANDMLTDGGWRVFFRGLGPSLLGIIPYAGIDLALYETLKSHYILWHGRSSNTLPCGWLLMFGTISASVGATVVYPLSLIRTRMQAQGSLGHPVRYSSAFQCIRKTYARESVRGFYRGLAPTLIKVIPAASISYLCYENMKLVMGL